MQISNLFKQRCIALIILCIMIVGTGYVVGELLRPVELETDIYNSEYNELKKSNTKIDMVFIGTSRTVLAFNPKILEKEMHVGKVYNLSTFQQDFGSTFFQLKEFIEEFHPKTVVLGITFRNLIAKTYPKFVKLRMIERLHGVNRMRYIKECLSINEYPEILSLYAYRENIHNFRENAKKRILFQKEGVFTYTRRMNMGQGFATVSKSVPAGNMGIRKNQSFDKSMVQEYSIYYLDKLVKLCKDNNVQLFFMTPPTSTANIYEIDNYQNIIEFIESYAKKNNVKYHNLSFLKDKETLLPDSMMYDYTHVNEAGSNVVSKKYAEILFKSRKNIDVSDEFYSSLFEMKKDVKRIVAVDAKPIIKKNNMKLLIQSLQNDDVTPFYQVLIENDKNKFKPVINWTSEKKVSFAVPKGSAYRVLLRARHNENDTNYAWMAWEVDERGKLHKIQYLPLSGV